MTGHDPVLARPSPLQLRWVSAALRDETTGGVLLLLAAVIALAWANSPWRDAYHALVAIQVGPESLHLNLTLQQWAADGLLAVFFFVAGLELKHELVLGTLSKPSKAAVPVTAAVAGMILPAVIYVAVVLGLGDPAGVTGWGIPMATDIAFALAVLAVVGRRLPAALRAFLLTLAIVDDLGAILVIALFYSHGFSPVPFAVALLGMGAWWWLQRRPGVSGWVFIALGIVVWALEHASGVHATVAGIALGLLTRVTPLPGEDRSPSERYEHLVRPISAGLCVPLFAFTAAGVTFIGVAASSLTSPVVVAIVAGLLLGKPLGVYGGARLVARYTHASLSESLRWGDVLAIGMLAGIGFTVSLLLSELAFEGDDARTTAAKTGVLIGSVATAALAAAILTLRRRRLAPTT